MSLQEIANYLDKATGNQDKENIIYFLDQAHHHPAVIDSDLLSNLIILKSQVQKWLYPFENERDNLIWLGDFEDSYRKDKIEKHQQELFEDLHFLVEKFYSVKDKKSRKSRKQKIVLIATYLFEHPDNPTDVEIAKATGINRSSVNRLRKDIEKLRKREKHRLIGLTQIESVEDKSASCRYCRIPLSKPFECSDCKEVIVGECKSCHYTNTHTDRAIP